MAKRSKAKKSKSPPKSRVRHGTRKWVKAVFKAGAGAEMRTSEIFRRLAKVAGSKIPTQSVYQALRTLVKRKQLSVRKAGRERVYAWIGSAGRALKKAGRAAKAPRVTVPVAAVSDSMPMPVPMPTEVAAAIADETAMRAVAAEQRERAMHKLVPGEIEIQQAQDTHDDT